MTRAGFAATLTAATTLGVLTAGCAREEQPAQTVAGQVPVYTDLGDHHYAITTDVPAAQTYFDQGLRLYYAFNHAEAVRSFRAGQALDPNCAMCWWGEALAWGPNINLPMDAESGLAAYAAIQHTLTLRDHASDVERELIDALSVRYGEAPVEDRSALDQAYADAMAGVATRHPEDPEVVVLYGESLMDLRPWDYWTADGRPKPGIEDALAGFERVIARDPKHPGACHFFIHAVEKVYPRRAVACAERLADLMPGAGHLVHMPGHIYVRVGRYEEAVEANMHAVHADETYIRDQMPGMGMYTAGYYPHNYDFLAFAASMIGRGAVAVEASDKVAALIPEEMFGAPGMDFLSHWSTRPYQVRVRFARWDELLATPPPPASRPHARAMWHYARGRALAATGDVPGARAHLDTLRTVAAGPALAGVRMEYNLSTDLLGIA
ncbi:MAG TPA: hypothetical protein VJ997_15590, partial [Longimicrobiales bacterium]|nr:hypothetical protein [Longimicrobiales bacterium]